MSTDSQGRPLSDDGQWAWSGTEWVPAAGAGETPQASADSGDAGATMIAQSPFAGGGAPSGGQPGGGAPAGPPAGAPGYGSDQGYGSTPGGAPGYGSTPGGAPGYAGAPGYGSPTPQKSRTPLIVAIVAAVVVIIAVVLILVFTLGSSSKKPSGAFACSTTVNGQTASGTLTFNSGNKYAITNGNGGSFKTDGSKVSFTSGDLNGSSGTFDSGANTFKFTFRGISFDCHHQ